jgi:hypothetical protein
MKKLFLASALIIAFAVPAMAGEVPNPPPGAFAVPGETLRGDLVAPYRFPDTESGIPLQYRLGG